VLRGRLLEDCRRSFQLYWDRLDSAEQRVLKSYTSSEEISSTQYGALASLELKGLVRYNAAGLRYEPFSPLFRDFLGEIDVVPSSFRRLDLTGLEANAYDYLRRHPDRICTYEELWQHVWRRPAGSTEKDAGQMRRALQVTLSRLRAKLRQQSTGENIISVRGQGYRFVPGSAAGRRPG
jgi:hypothetical protein